MIIADTNVLLRVLVTDDDQQSNLACQLFKTAVTKGKRIFIPTAVQVEVFWVLRQSYKLNKESLCNVLSLLKNNAFYCVENPNVFNTALTLYSSNNADFADYLILANAQLHRQAFWTFDKKLAKHTDVTLLNQTNLDDFLIQ